MTRITKPRRSRGPVKRLDLTDMRALFRDRRVWTSIGTVIEPDDGGPHWEVVTEDGETIDVTIEVELQPSQEPVTCRLRAGMWDVPDLGDEVIVMIPEGVTDFMPIAVGRLSGNSVPTVQGPQPGRIVLERDEVIVHDGGGGAQPTLRGDDYRSAEDALHGAMNTLGTTLATAIAALAAAAPALAGTPAQIAAWEAAVTAVASAATALTDAAATFNAGAASYLTTVLKAK